MTCARRSQLRLAQTWGGVTKQSIEGCLPLVMVTLLVRPQGLVTWALVRPGSTSRTPPCLHYGRRGGEVYSGHEVRELSQPIGVQEGDRGPRRIGGRCGRLWGIIRTTDGDTGVRTVGQTHDEVGFSRRSVLDADDV